MEKVSRRSYGWLAFFAFLGLTLSLILTALNIDPVAVTDQTLFHQNTAAIRIIGFFSYFTIWSNILVVYVSCLLALGRTLTKNLQTLYATALVMISITGLVYNTVLLPAYPPKGWYWLTSALMHLVAPLMYIALWLRYGPRGYIRFDKTLPILTIPIIYLVYTVIHGLTIEEWPYKFLDLTSEGFILWFIGVAIIFGFGVMLIYGFSKVDQRPVKAL